jgi:hypothetical protein
MNCIGQRSKPEIEGAVPNLAMSLAASSVGILGLAEWLIRPGEEHRARFGNVGDDEVQPGSTQLIVHEQQGKPKLAAGVVDTDRTMVGVSELP